MAVARLEPDGAVADANRCFVRAAGGPESEFEPSGGAWNAAGSFIRPTFGERLGRRAAADGDPVFLGIFNLGRPEATPASLKGRAYRCGGGLFIIAEHDPEDGDQGCE